MKEIFTNISAMQKHIQPLNINGLSGRMLRLLTSSKKTNRELIIVYGHHSSLERMYGIAEDFSQYGNVTVPDLPGFGGMDSFYKIGMKPTIDNLADYLATFLKLRCKKKKVTLIGMSLGFAIVTRMLQRHPEIAKKVDILISMAGFSHRHDFLIPKKRVRNYKIMASIFSRRIPAAFFYNICLHPVVLRAVYSKMKNAKSKFENLNDEEKRQALEFEVILWRENDVRTYMSTAKSMFNLDNCDKQVLLPVHHISVDNDQYFDNSVVEQHMRVIFTDFTDYKAYLPNHAPSILATKEEAAPLVPKKIRRLLK